MAQITINSIGSTRLSYKNPTTNYSGTSDNVIGSYEDRIVYVFDCSAMAKKKISSFKFSFNITNYDKRYVKDDSHKDDGTTTNPCRVKAFFYANNTYNWINTLTYNNRDDYLRGTIDYSNIDVTYKGNYHKSANFDNNVIFEEYPYFYVIVAAHYYVSQGEPSSYTHANVAKTATLTFECSDPLNYAGINYPNGDVIHVGTDYIAETLFQSDTAGVKALTQSASVTQGSKTTNLSLIDTDGYTTHWRIPANTINVGNATFNYSATGEGGNNVSVSASFSGQDATPRAIPEYPVGNVVRASKEIVFTWQYISEPFNSPQKSVTIRITQGGSTITKTATTADSFYTLPANTLSVGEASYTITVVNTDNQSYTSDPVTFSVIAQSDAPDITTITQTAIPTVSWTASYQDAYEVKVLSGNDVIYESGLLFGKDVRQYTIPIILDNGQYSIWVRILNTYGEFSEWSSKSYVLNPGRPSKQTDIKITVDELNRVTVTAVNINAFKQYVVRRDLTNGEEKLIKKPSVSVTDYTARPNTPYEYSVRTVNGGYRDGDYEGINMPLEGVILYGTDGIDAIRLDRSKDNFEISHSENTTRSLVKCLGRKYPVKEGREWVDTVREFSAFVHDYEMDKLLRIIQSEKTYYKAENEFFACDIEASSTTDYVTGGKLLKFTITRIDEEEESIL